MKLISGCVIYTHTYNWRVCISSLRGADTIFGQLKSGKKNYKGVVGFWSVMGFFLVKTTPHQLVLVFVANRTT